MVCLRNFTCDSRELATCFNSVDKNARIAHFLIYVEEVKMLVAGIMCIVLLGLTEGLPTRKLNIAHRGACGMVPEHTVAAYELAVKQGADVIECDLTVTKDYQLVCLHEAWLNATTNVAQHEEFKDRVRTYEVHEFGVLTDYFAIDFTLAELKTLRKVQQHEYRDQNYNGLYEIATFDEYVKVAKSAKRTVGIYPEIKDPAFVNTHPHMKGMPSFERLAIDAIHKHGYTKRSDPCFVQCFSENVLHDVVKMTDLRTIMLTEELPEYKIKQWSNVFYGVGPWKEQLVPSVSDKNGNKNYLGKPTGLLEKLHDAGLQVHAYTFRSEDRYLAHDYGQDIHEEFAYFEKLGIDGFFTDFTHSLTRYFKAQHPNSYPYELTLSSSDPKLRQQFRY